MDLWRNLFVLSEFILDHNAVEGGAGIFGDNMLSNFSNCISCDFYFLFHLVQIPMTVNHSSLPLLIGYGLVIVAFVVLEMVNGLSAIYFCSSIILDFWLSSWWLHTSCISPWCSLPTHSTPIPKKVHIICTAKKGQYKRWSNYLCRFPLMHICLNFLCDIF